MTPYDTILTMQGRGSVLQTAREVTELFRSEGIKAAVIGGVAVALHGCIRSTVNVDVFIHDPDRAAEALIQHGFTHDPEQRQYVKDGVPVRLVTRLQASIEPMEMMEIDGIRTVSLADLINLKLRSGARNLLRARDLADVIDLIRLRELTLGFASRIDPSLREEFRKVIEAIDREKDIW
jgi:hypothetical protein